MKKTRKQQIVQLKLTLDGDFYQLIQKKATNDYMKVATWTKQFLMKNLLNNNDSNSKCITRNGNKMDI